MALSPDDIVNHEFNLAVRGYAKVEVDDLLDRLADQIERADRDIAELRERVRVAEARAAEAAETEATLKRTLVTAEDAAQRTVDKARAEADALRADAQEESEALLEQAGRKAEALVADAERDARAVRDRHQAEEAALAERVVAMAAIEDRYRGQLRALLEGQLGALHDLESFGPPGGDDVDGVRREADAAASEAVPLDAHDGSGEVDHVLEDLDSESTDFEPETDADPFPSFSRLKVRVHADDAAETETDGGDGRDVEPGEQERE